MQKELLEKLKVITKEENEILNGKAEIEKGIYTASPDFVVDSKKMLDSGKLIDIRVHTRFTHFPKHRHNYIEIIYMCSGQTTHLINDTKKVVLKKGDVLFLNQNAYQEIQPSGIDDISVNFIVLPEFFDVAFTMMEESNSIREFIIGRLKQNCSRMDYLHFKVADVLPIQNLIENLIWSIMNKQANRRQINQITMGLLLLHLLNYTEKLDNNDPNQYEQNQILQILRYIENNYRDGSLTEIAKKMNQSVYQLSRIIKSNMGQTFKELLQKKRLNQAIYLLTTTQLPVEEIIYAVGYDNTSYFHKIFKKEYDMTPKHYRDQYEKRK
jgi:AraC-like DNA-binding protein